MVIIRPDLVMRRTRWRRNEGVRTIRLKAVDQIPEVLMDLTLYGHPIEICESAEALDDVVPDVGLRFVKRVLEFIARCRYDASLGHPCERCAKPDTLRKEH